MNKFLSASAALAVMTSLTACGGAKSPENMVQTSNELAQQDAASTGPEGDIPAALSNVSRSDPDVAGGAKALPPSGAFRFVGLWAAEADMCDDQAWRFTRESMETPAGSVCKFVNATPVGGGYDISARCVAEGPPVDDMLKIRFAESAQAMLFEAESIADAGLIYCGALD